VFCLGITIVMVTIGLVELTIYPKLWTFETSAAVDVLTLLTITLPSMEMEY
jgi:hypothetical protein